MIKPYIPEKNKIYGMMKDMELVILHDIVGSFFKKGCRSVNVLEIGSYLGRSSHAICSAMSQYPDPGCFVSMDNFSRNCEGYSAEALESGFKKNITDVFPRKTIDQFNMSSDEAFDRLSDRVYFDVIYIDGAHDYESVKKDLINSWLHLVDGGIIVGHDYRRELPDRVFKAANEAVGVENMMIIPRTRFFITKKQVIRPVRPTKADITL